MDEYSIRLANRSDLFRLAKIERAAGKRFSGMGLIDHLLGQTFSPTKLAELIEKRQVLVSCKGSISVGFVVVSVLEKNAYLEEIDVLPEYGGQGHGTRLIQIVIEWAMLNELNALRLATFSEVPWNAPFYKKLGFRVLEMHEWDDHLHKKYQEEKELGLPVDKRVFMQLDLGKSLSD